MYTTNQLYNRKYIHVLIYVSICPYTLIYLSSYPSTYLYIYKISDLTHWQDFTRMFWQASQYNLVAKMCCHVPNSSDGDMHYKTFGHSMKWNTG